MSTARIPVGLLVCSANRSTPAKWWPKDLVVLSQEQKGCNESRTRSGRWSAMRPMVYRIHTWETKLLGTFKCISPLICHFGYEQTLGLEFTFYEVVEGSKGEVVTRRCRCWISPRAALIGLVLSLCWHVMSPTKLCVLSVEWAQPKRTWFTLFHKKRLLIPIWKKSTLVFLPCFNLKKNNACLHQSTLLPHMVLIFINPTYSCSLM